MPSKRLAGHVRQTAGLNRQMPVPYLRYRSRRYRHQVGRPHGERSLHVTTETPLYFNVTTNLIFCSYKFGLSGCPAQNQSTNRLGCRLKCTASAADVPFRCNLFTCSVADWLFFHILQYCNILASF